MKCYIIVLCFVFVVVLATPGKKRVKELCQKFLDKLPKEDPKEKEGKKNRPLSVNFLQRNTRIISNTQNIQLSLHHLIAGSTMNIFLRQMLKGNEKDHTLLLNIFTDLYEAYGNFDETINCDLALKCFNSSIDDIGSHSNDECFNEIWNCFYVMFYWRRDNIVIGPTSRLRDRENGYDVECLMLHLPEHIELLDNFRRIIYRYINEIDMRDTLREELYSIHRQVLWMPDGVARDARWYNEDEWIDGSTIPSVESNDKEWKKIEDAFDYHKNGHNSKKIDIYQGKKDFDVFKRQDKCRVQTMSTFSVNVACSDDTKEEIRQQIIHLIELYQQGRITNEIFEYLKYLLCNPEEQKKLFERYIEFREQFIFRNYHYQAEFGVRCLENAATHQDSMKALMGLVLSMHYAEHPNEMPSNLPLQYDTCPHYFPTVYYHYEFHPFFWEEFIIHASNEFYRQQKMTTPKSSTPKYRVRSKFFYKFKSEKYYKILEKALQDFSGNDTSLLPDFREKQKKDDDDDEDDNDINKFHDMLKANKDFEYCSKQMNFMSIDKDNEDRYCAPSTSQRKLAPVQYIMNNVCLHRYPTQHQYSTWREFYDSTDLHDFANGQTIVCDDGSLVIGVESVEKMKFDPNTRELMNSYSLVMTTTSLLPVILASTKIRDEFRRKRRHDTAKYHGKLIVDRNRRPVLIAMLEGPEFISFAYFVNGVWRQESNHHWNIIFPPHNAALSRDRRAPIMEQCYGLQNLASVKYILDNTCNTMKATGFANWIELYDNMDLDTFDTLIAMETMDGSYAVGIETPRRNYYDIHHDLVTDEWTIPKKYNTRTTDFSTGPYHGVLIVDKHDRVVLAAFRENYYYIALHYLDHTGTWRWANNHNWPKLFNTSFDESKAVNSPQMKRCHGKHVHIF